MFTDMPQFNLQKVIIDGLEVNAFFVGSYDDYFYFLDSSVDAFVISFLVFTDAQKKKVINLSDACFNKNEIEFTICDSNINKTSKIISVAFSSDEETGSLFENYKAIQKCTVIFELKYRDYKNLI